MGRLGAGAALLVAGVIAAGCGDDDDKASGRSTTSVATTSATTTPETLPSNPSDVAAVRKVVREWGRADTPEEACALMSARLQSGVFGPELGECQNKKAFEAAIGAKLKPTTVRATKITFREGAADAESEGGADFIFHLVKEDGSWKVDTLEQR